MCAGRLSCGRSAASSARSDSCGADSAQNETERQPRCNHKQSTSEKKVRSEILWIARDLTGDDATV